MKYLNQKRAGKRMYDSRFIANFDLTAHGVCTQMKIRTIFVTLILHILTYIVHKKVTFIAVLFNLNIHNLCRQCNVQKMLTNTYRFFFKILSFIDMVFI